YVLGHHHDGLKINAFAVRTKACFENDVASSFGKDPFVFGVEGDENRMTRTLQVGEFAAVLVFALQRHRRNCTFQKPALAHGRGRPCLHCSKCAWVCSGDWNLSTGGNARAYTGSWGAQDFMGA